MVYTLNSLIGKLKSGETVIGPFSKSSDPAFIEICGYAGFDFIILDMEHGPSNTYILQNLIRGAQVAGIAPIVRVGAINEEISRVLDIGAAGVQIPQISSAAQAMEAVKLAKFSPMGDRGVCRFVRAANYSSTDRFEYFKTANETVVILQIEGKEGIENIDSILSVEGIDIIFIGPYDLSQSLGLPGQVEHPLVEQEMKKIIDACKKRGIITGTFTDSIESAKKWKAVGVQYISHSVDVGLFSEVCKEHVKRIRE